LWRFASSDVFEPPNAGHQKRHLHTSRRTLISRPIHGLGSERSFHLEKSQVASLLQEFNIPISSSPGDNAPETSYIIGIAIARSARQPCILVSPTSSYADIVQIPFDISNGPRAVEISEALTNLGLRRAPGIIREAVDDLIHSLWSLFSDQQAISVTVSIDAEDGDQLSISNPQILLDPAAKTTRKADESNSGIVYLPMPDPKANVGTLVNGAGLAMNTVDALTFRGVSATNFMDTGGKATSQTVSTGLEMILEDPRVKVVFVNIFGGLTKGDMIAEGIVQAFEKKKAEGGIKVPVVVRIRGTREKEGQLVIQQSGLNGIWAFDDFEEAVKKIKELLA
jgi:succinyl-CoA synthetase alpha subunit